MSRLAVLALAALVAGCKGGGSTPDACDAATYSWPHDITGSTGLTLHAPDNAVTFLPFEAIEDEWRSLAACAVPGVATPGPRVEFRSFRQLGIGQAWGVYAASGSVYINTDESPDVARNCHSDRSTLRHEYTHYVLWMNGRDWHHSAPEFAACDAMGPNVVDGVAAP